MKDKVLLLENGEVKELSYVKLYFYYKAKGLVTMSDIKYVGWFEEEFVPYRMNCGDPIFFENETPIERHILASDGKNKYTFSSIEEGIDFIKTNKISSASLGTIKSTIFRNLTGKSKSAYGMEWKIEPI